MKKLKQVLKIFSNIFIYSFIILSLAILVITIVSKKSYNNTCSIFNYELRIVITDSMKKNDNVDVSSFKIKSIPKNSLILVEKVKNDSWYDHIKEGDVLTFKYVYNEQVTITHRVSKIIKKENGGYLIELIGDNRSNDENTMIQYIDTSLTDSPNFVIGKVVYKSIVLGTILNSIKKPVGIICLIIIPSFIIILLEAIKIINLILLDKKNKELEVSSLKDQEIYELKKKLKELESKNI